MDEKSRVLMEASMFAACDEYFNARPQIDTNFARRVFEAGFTRAWVDKQKFKREGGE